MYLINRKRFTLNNIEVLLKAELHPANIEASIQNQSLATLQQLLSKTGLEAVESLQAFRYEIPQRDFEQLCQQNYSDLFRLEDRFQIMQGSLASESLNAEAKALYDFLWKVLEEVRVYLEGRGIRGMAAAELLPRFYLEKRQSLLKANNQVLLAKCKARMVDTLLQNLLTRHFEVFVCRADVSQTELWYAEQLMSTLLNVMAVKPEANVEQQLMESLICINFNAYDFYHYCSQQLRTFMDTQQGNKAKLLELSWRQKSLMQLLPQPGVALQPHYPDLKILLLDFLLAERSYLEAAIRDEQVRDVRPAAATGKIGYKLLINGNMRELCLFVQLMMQCDVIALGKGGIKAISSFLAEHISTKGSERLSAESLAKRYREAQPGCCNAVLQVLENMILILKRDFINKTA